MKETDGQREEAARAAGRKKGEKSLLIVVDMQNDFVSGALGSSDAAAILPLVKEKLAAARAAGMEIVFTRDTHGADYLCTQEGKKLPVPHCIAGTDGHEIAPGLYGRGEKIFDKPVFGSTELAEYVRAVGYREAELIGVCTDICVVSNALLIKAFAPETEVLVDSACCAGTSRENHAAALQTMRCCQVTVL